MVFALWKLLSVIPAERSFKDIRVGWVIARVDCIFVAINAEDNIAGVYATITARISIVDAGCVTALSMIVTTIYGVIFAVYKRYTITDRSFGRSSIS